MRALLRTSMPAALLAASLATAAQAQTPSFEDKGLSGEASVAGSAKTGNTESTDLGVSFKLRYETPKWRNILGGAYDWGRADGKATKDRLATSYELARLVNHRIYAFGRAAYEADQFSGYDSRSVVGGGMGVDILTGDVRTWSLQGGPAYRVDEVTPSFDEAGVLVTSGGTETGVAGALGSRFFAQVNDAVTLQNDTDVTSSSETQTFFNTTALTAELMGAISARVSFDVLHDASPPIGAEQTDTTTRAALVYKFGE